jgi:hypothetical protein
MDASLVTPAGLEKLTADLELLRSQRETLLEGIKTTPEGAGQRGASAELFDAPDELARSSGRLRRLRTGWLRRPSFGRIPLTANSASAKGRVCATSTVARWSNTGLSESARPTRRREASRTHRRLAVRCSADGLAT